MLEPLLGTTTSGVYFGSLKIFLLYVKLENVCRGTSLSISVGYSELENLNPIDIFVHVTCYPETTADVTHCEKTQCSILKTKYSENPL